MEITMLLYLERGKTIVSSLKLMICFASHQGPTFVRADKRCFSWQRRELEIIFNPYQGVPVDGPKGSSEKKTTNEEGHYLLRRKYTWFIM
jgi:hypothetical protein